MAESVQQSHHFQTLNPPPQGGHLHNRRLLGQGIHAAAAAAGERDASVAPEEAARAGGATRSTVANQIAEEKTEKQETWPGTMLEHDQPNHWFHFKYQKIDLMGLGI